MPVLFTDRDGLVKIRNMYWQLIYSWSEEFKSKYTTFNIRAESLGKNHNRMPFIVPAPECRTWLDPDVTDFDSLADIVGPYESGEMVRARTA